VSAPLFLVAALPDGATFTLDGPEGRHAATVQRLRVGEPLVLGDGRGGAVRAEVIAVGSGTVDVSLGERTMTLAPDPRIVVAQALAKGDRGELAVQVMTEVGVDRIVPWSAARSIARWVGDRGEKAWQRWEATVREATKQARRSWRPELGTPASTADLVNLVRASSACLVLHEAATSAIGAVPLPPRGDVLLIVGPEGGVTDDELAAFESAGAQAVRLGESVMRTSTAGAAGIAALSVRLGRW